MQVVLNRRDKEQLVIKFIRKVRRSGKSHLLRIYRLVILASIIRKIDGRDDDVLKLKDIKNKSKDTQACILFSTGKKPIDVAIELDLSASEVQNMLEEFWALNRSS